LNSTGAYGTHAAVIGVPAYNEDSYTLAVRVVHEEDDDVQVILPGQSGNSATDVCVSSGNNGKRDTIKGGDDVYSGQNILVGANLRCDTTADNTDDMTDSYSASGLISYLNDYVYNQAVVKWSTITQLSDMTVNFDLNNDGDLDISSWTTAEMDVIINQCNPSGYDNVVFLVNDPSILCRGISSLGVRYAFVFPDMGGNEDLIIAHELGHAAFSLGDLSPEPPLYIVDNDNLMYYDEGVRLRVGQWNQIHQ